MTRRFRRDTTILERCFQDRAAVELSHGRAIELLPGCSALWNGRNAILLAALDLILRHERVAAPRIQVNADEVTGMQPCQTAADRALGRRVKDRGAVGRSGLPSIANGRQRRNPSL